jgi:hypothetical protein
MLIKKKIYMNKLSINYSKFHSHHAIDLDLSEFDIEVIEIYKSNDFGWMYKIDTAQGVVSICGNSDYFTKEQFSKLKMTLFKSYPYYQDTDRYVMTFFTR